MTGPDAALATQLTNLQSRSGKTLAQLLAILRDSGLSKHGQLRDLLKSQLGMGHGDANLLAHLFLNPVTAGAGNASPDAVLDELYSGGKAALRPIHDAVMSQLTALGAFEVAPKKAYVSLRRNKQFAMLGPATKTRVDLGLNVKALADHPRLQAQASGGMCQYKIALTSVDEVDAQLMDWITLAYNSAG